MAPQPGISVAQANNLLSDADRLAAAQVQQALASNGDDVVVYPIDLSTAQLQSNPFVISVPFKALYVVSATDGTCTVNVQLNAKSPDPAKTFALYQKDVLDSDRQIAQAFLSWAAQPGKKMTIVAFRQATIKSGSFIQTTNGGTAISEGSLATTAAVVSLTTGAAQLILAQDVTRKVSVLENQGSIPVYLGGSTATAPTGAAPGITLNSGERAYWKNSAALYGCTANGTNGNIAVLVEQ